MLLKQLGSLQETEIEVIQKDDHKQIVSVIIKNLKKAHDKHEKCYNVRSREAEFKPGQEVYGKNVSQSDFKNNFNTKLAKKFIKKKVVRKNETALYELEDMNGKVIHLRSS